MNKLCVSDSEYRIISSILHGESDVYVFGSRVTGTHNDFSDIDICFKQSKPLSVSKIGQLQAAFEESDLPYSVDLVDYHCVDQTFKNIIDASAVKFDQL